MQPSIILKQRKRKSLLILPLVIIPLLTLLFSAIRGCQGSLSPSHAATHSGANFKLPGAQIKEDTDMNKLAIYEKAEQDSLRLKEQLDRANLKSVYTPPSFSAGGRIDQQEAAIKNKLEALDQLVNQHESQPPQKHALPVQGGLMTIRQATPRPLINSSGLDRLERMLHVMKENESAGSDPQMQELNKTLDKLIDVQRPPSRRENHDSAHSTGTSEPRPLPVALVADGLVFLPPKENQPRSTRFYSLSQPETPRQETMIEAQIPQAQTLVSGSLLRLELTNELLIAGDHIPKGTPLIGITSLQGERLLVSIKAIRHGGKVYPVNLQVLDQDGLPGIFEPGSISREAARQSAGQALGTIGNTSFDPSIGAQAASAGIQLARNLATHKVRLVRVSVPSGYRIYLQDKSNNQPLN